MGKDSASINALIYRGNTQHFYKIPKLLTWLTTIRQENPTFAPKWFTYGSLKKTSSARRSEFGQGSGLIIPFPFKN